MVAARRYRTLNCRAGSGAAGLAVCACTLAAWSWLATPHDDQRVVADDRTQTAHGAETSVSSPVDVLEQRGDLPRAPVAKATAARLRLKDPDVKVRIQLAESVTAGTPRDLILALLKDQEPRVRAATLEALRKLPADAEIAPRVHELAERDPASTVSGFAKLLEAEWALSPPTTIPGAEGAAPPRRGASQMPRRGTSRMPRSGASFTPRSDEKLPPHGAVQPSLPRSARLIPVIPPRHLRVPGGRSAIEQANYDEPAGEDDTAGPTLMAPGAIPRAAESLNNPFSAERELSSSGADSSISESAPNAAAGPAVVAPFAKPRGGIQPDVLRRPIAPVPEFGEEPPFLDDDSVLLTYFEAPLGFTGPSGIIPSELQENSHFVPVEDRWRVGFPEWDRYGKGHPPEDDYPYVEGHWWDPYNQNVLKGDYPLIGQHTFLNITGSLSTLQEYRTVPTPTTPFESTVSPFQEEFFGDDGQYFSTNSFKLSFNLFHGDAAFKPVDWQVRLTPIFNFNYLDVEELGIVNPDVRDGTTRFRTFTALEEWFVEGKLADLSPDYDFVSLRIGSQPFTSDFRGFIFSDVNRGVRLFGTLFANRDQFNLVFFDQTEKDTNSQLNTFDDRQQNTLIANYFRQDFVFPGYTLLANFHFNTDGPSVHFDENDFLARPDAAGVFQPHEVEAYYFGIAGDGHIERINITHAFYWAVGEDSLNPIAGRPQDIEAMMAAIEASYDRDWIRFRGSFLWASGDHDVNDNDANGFDSIFDKPNFAGGEFSYWQRQQIPLFGVSLVNRVSLVPDLRSSKFQGQSNFVNPGLFIYNLGMDFDVTPKLKLISNANYLMFESTAVLRTFTFQDEIDRSIDIDLSLGAEYRPLLNDNVILRAGIASLIPGAGFKDLYGVQDPFVVPNSRHADVDPLFSSFMELVLTY